MQELTDAKTPFIRTHLVASYNHARVNDGYNADASLLTGNHSTTKQRRGGKGRNKFRSIINFNKKQKRIFLLTQNTLNPSRFHIWIKYTLLRGYHMITFVFQFVDTNNEMQRILCIVGISLIKPIAISCLCVKRHKENTHILSSHLQVAAC
jgi:hypothetical protein